MKPEFHEGDRVEYIGPPSDQVGDPRPGEQGWVLIEDPPDEWVVSWERAGTAVCPQEHLLRVGDRNEPNRQNRWPGRPLGGPPDDADA